MTQRADPFRDTANWAFVGIALFVLYFGFPILVNPVIATWSLMPHIADAPEVIDAFYLGSTPVGVWWNLGLFGVYIALLWVVMRVLHSLPIVTLVGAPATALLAGVRTGLILIPLYALALGPALADSEVFRQMTTGAWLAILPLTLPLLMVQIGAEELVFRGYLQSHLRALSKHPIVWMLIPSVLFGLVHYDPTQPTYSAWIYVVWATGLGLVCADVTARHGTLGPALAIHFVNNFFALCVLASDDWLFGTSLYIWPTFGEPWTPWIPYEVLFLLTVWLATRVAIRR